MSRSTGSPEADRPVGRPWTGGFEGTGSKLVWGGGGGGGGGNRLSYNGDLCMGNRLPYNGKSHIA